MWNGNNVDIITRAEHLKNWREDLLLKSFVDGKSAERWQGLRVLAVDAEAVDRDIRNDFSRTTFVKPSNKFLSLSTAHATRLKSRVEGNMGDFPTYHHHTLVFLYEKYRELRSALVKYEWLRREARLPVIRPLSVVLVQEDHEQDIHYAQLSDWGVNVEPVPHNFFHGEESLYSYVREIHRDFLSGRILEPGFIPM